MSKIVHYCKCGNEIGGDLRLCEACASLASARGMASANIFIAKVERSARIRVQRLMWELADENRALGGKKWKKVLRRFGLKENEIWLEKPLANNQDCD